MFISVLDLFKIGVGPSSSHTMGPMLAAGAFLSMVRAFCQARDIAESLSIRCILHGSLSATGRGHATDKAVALGLHGFSPEDAAAHDLDSLVARIENTRQIAMDGSAGIGFRLDEDVIFDRGPPLPEHPNGMTFQLCNAAGEVLLTERYFSIGGGFVCRSDELGDLDAPLKMSPVAGFPYPFDSARAMLEMAAESGLSVAAMKRCNEQALLSPAQLDAGLDAVWQAMRECVERGLRSEGVLPGGLGIVRRAKSLHESLNSGEGDINQRLCAYAMAVNEENAAGRRVVTAPTNGAAGVIPAVLYCFVQHAGGDTAQVREFLLTAAAIGGLIKHRSSISGAEVGCQGEVGSAAAMAAAGLCAVRGGSAQQVEHAAEIALEHHLGMTCDPVAGLVQVPCIERNGFGAIKAWAAAGLALHDTGEHYMSLDRCIAAMKQTGEEMSTKFKETSQGGLAVALSEC